MITVANRIYVKQEYADAFEQRFRDRAGLVDKMPGFISNHVLRPLTTATRMWFLRSGIAARIFLTGCVLMSLLRDMRSQALYPRMLFPRQTSWRCMR